MKKPSTDTHFPLPRVADITCMDPNRAPQVAEKVCKTVRLLGYIIQNGVSKSKVIHDVQDVMKRGKNIGKALTCRPSDPHVSFVSPLEYQFSCSGSPPRAAHVARRKLSPPATAPRQGRRAVRMCGGGDGTGTIERRVKIVGSAASMLNDSEKDFHVDEAAEEFIARFYRELRLQKWLDHYC